MNQRKILGTIIGLIFWSFCVVFFTYAYYDWKSAPTNVVLGIEDLSVECIVGDSISATNIGPVINYQDGVKSEFSIKNPMAEVMAIELRLDIIDISDNLLTESLKYILVADTLGGTNYDYNNPIIEGAFNDFSEGDNLITKALEVSSENITNYQFIIYIDGNMDNNPNMQENNLIANLMIGNCVEDAIPMSEMAYQAIYSESDQTLTFIYNKKLKVGDIYNEKEVTAVYTGFETATYKGHGQVPWNSIEQNVKNVVFEDVIKPKNTSYWFHGFSKLTNINLEKLDTSIVTSMRSMFEGCKNLTILDLSNFDTSKVTDMYGMFSECGSLQKLDLSNFDTSKVTNMGAMFYSCNYLTTLDLSEWDISKVTNMLVMFQNCYSLMTDITIKNNTLSDYRGIFVNTSIRNGGRVVVNYTSETSSLVDSMIATKSSKSNVVKGVCIGDNCPTET